jgi:hypothetical protein
VEYAPGPGESDVGRGDPVLPDIVKAGPVRVLSMEAYAPGPGDSVVCT